MTANDEGGKFEKLLEKSNNNSTTGHSDAELMNQALKYRGVFNSLDAVLAPLKSEQYSSLPEVAELLKIYNSSLAKFEAENKSDYERKPFIVLEGLDGSGKSTITKKLAAKLGGKNMNTPPQSVLHLRPVFDEHEPELRRAYYGLGNYIAAAEAKSIMHNRPVVMDRFWCSTTAYAIGNEVKEGKPLPPRGMPLYNWPSDLLLPDYIIYLQVSETVRLQRLSRRQTFTKEENELKDIKAFRDNLEELYRRMVPSLHIVDGNGTVKQVVTKIQQDILKM